MDLLLRFVDFLLRLQSPEPGVVPEPDPAGTSDSRMAHLYAELGQEVRALRATEGTMIAAFFAFSALLFAGSAAILAADELSLQIQQVVVIGVVVCLVIFWWMVHARIAHDNASYRHLMSRRRWIEERWFWPGMPGRPLNAAKGGSGPGYRKSQALVAFSAVAVSAVLLVSLFLVTTCAPVGRTTRTPAAEGASAPPPSDLARAFCRQ